MWWDLDNQNFIANLMLGLLLKNFQNRSTFDEVKAKYSLSWSQTGPRLVADLLQTC